MLVFARYILLNLACDTARESLGITNQLCKRSATDGAALQVVTARTRWAVEQLVRELRDANFHTAHFMNGSGGTHLFADHLPTTDYVNGRLLYKKVEGFDESTMKVDLEPDGSSGDFRSVWMTTSGRSIMLTIPGVGDVLLAAQMGTLEFTSFAGNPTTGEPPQLKIVVEATQRDSRGEIVYGRQEATINLRNYLDPADVD